jgi:hypothetical protein
MPEGRVITALAERRYSPQRFVSIDREQIQFIRRLHLRGGIRPFIKGLGKNLLPRLESLYCAQGLTGKAAAAGAK